MKLPLKKGDALIVSLGGGSERAVRFVQWEDCVLVGGHSVDCFLGEDLFAVTRTRRKYFAIDILKKIESEEERDKAFIAFLRAK